ncbi:MAG: hypothetical protein ACI8PT_004573 [Gammaproteobacteria bacterium]|jgi:hypothetical protein
MRLILLTFVTLFSTSALAATFGDQLVEAAVERTKHDVHYDGRYFLLGRTPMATFRPTLGFVPTCSFARTARYGSIFSKPYMRT